MPENFNFAYDVVDEWARVEPDKKALVWINDAGEEREFTFTDYLLLSNRAANAFRKLGIRKGDVVMLMLRRRWGILGVRHGAVQDRRLNHPATIQLTSKDIAYRANSAAVKMLICVDDDYVVEQVEARAQPRPASKRRCSSRVNATAGCPSTSSSKTRATSGSVPRARMPPKSTISCSSTSRAAPRATPRPWSTASSIRSGTSPTAKYWQQVRTNRLHMSVTDSGWAKFGWGKIYGQWIAGAAIFAYDMDKFVPTKLLQKIQDYKLTTFCAPPTMYRFMLQEDVAAYDLPAWRTSPRPASRSTRR